MRITSVRGTDLFTGPAAAPRQVVEVTLAGVRRAPVQVRVHGPSVSTPAPVIVGPGDEQVTVEVGVTFAAPVREGTLCQVTAVAEAPAGRVTLSGTVTVAETGWTMWLISHFHYDPVWWNTQAGFTDTWLDLPQAQEKRMPFQRSAFDLVRAHLAAAREDEDYRFVLAEVDYLKPHWDLYPRDRADLRRFIADGRIEIVGAEHEPDRSRVDHPQRDRGRRLPARRARRRPADRLAARRVRPRPGVPRDHGGRRPGLQRVGPRPLAPRRGQAAYR
jgi:alpha-mannosidase